MSYAWHLRFPLIFLLVLSSVEYRSYAQDNQTGQPPKLSQTDLPAELTASEKARLAKKNAREFRALEKKLRRKIPSNTRREFLEIVVPAIQTRSDAKIVASMINIIGKRSKDSIAAIDTYCTQLGYGSLVDYTKQKILEAIEQGHSVPVTVNDQVRQFVMTAINEAIDADLEELRKHKLMQDPLKPNNHWESSEQIFWEIHVWKNRFDNLQRLANQAIALKAQQVGRTKVQDPDHQVNDVLDPDKKLNQLNEVYIEVLERELELRMKEIPFAEQTLREPGRFEDRLHAAFQLEMHAGAIDSLTVQIQTQSNLHAQTNFNFSRPYLIDKRNFEQTNKLIESARNHGKDVINKAVLLRVGAHWWLRGRYGMGPLAQGLMKPMSALKNPQTMFALYMPKKRPAPIGQIAETTGTIQPGYQRKHYYTWAIEKQEVFFNLSSNSSSSESGRTKLGDSKGSYFY